MVKLPQVTTEGDFRLFPEAAFVFALIDFERGLQGNPRFAKEGEAPKERAKWTFQCVSVINSLDPEAEDFIGDEFWAWSSVSMHPKANMYRWSAALLGREPDELEVIDTDELMGKTLRAQVEHYTVDTVDGAQTRHRFASVRADREMPAPGKAGESSLTPEALAAVNEQFQKLEYGPEDVQSYLQANYKVDRLQDMTLGQARGLHKKLERLVKAEVPF